MDLKMRAEKISDNKNPEWDVKVINGIVPIISGDEEKQQRAVIAGFLETGTVPQLENAGVPWQNFITGGLTFGELDALIRNSINNAGVIEYYPQYEIEGEKLTLTIGTGA